MYEFFPQVDCEILGIATLSLFPQISEVPSKLLALIRDIAYILFDFIVQEFRRINQWLHEVNGRKVTSVFSNI